MAKHTAARVGLVALLVLAAAAHVSADLTGAVKALGGLQGKLAGLTASAGGGARSDKGDRGDVAQCWGNTLTCTYTNKCASSKCQCCGCPCATGQCLFNVVKSTYVAVESFVKTKLTTAAKRKAAAKDICELARLNARTIPTLIKFYRTAKCPGYTATIKTLNGYQSNYNKWCKGFSG